MKFPSLLDTGEVMVCVSSLELDQCQQYANNMDLILIRFELNVYKSLKKKKAENLGILEILSRGKEIEKAIAEKCIVRCIRILFSKVLNNFFS